MKVLNVKGMRLTGKNRRESWMNDYLVCFVSVAWATNFILCTTCFIGPRTKLSPTLYFPDKPKLCVIHTYMCVCVCVFVCLRVCGVVVLKGSLVLTLVHFHTSYGNISLQWADPGSTKRFIHLVISLFSSTRYISFSPIYVCVCPSLLFVGSIQFLYIITNYYFL